MVKKLLLFALLGAAVWLFFRMSKRPRVASSAAELDVLDLQNALQRGEPWLVLDVRGPREFNDDLGHIRGARNVPLEALAASIRQYADEPSRPIAVICRTDSRSRKAQAQLQRLGYRQVRVVRGGMQAWVEQHLPVTRG